jgi:histidinol-phosphate aminotransferase
MRRLWREVLDRVSPYEAGKPLEELQAELGLSGIIRLSANEHPEGPSPRVVEALSREAARSHLYPDGGGTALRQALSRHLGVPPEWIILGNGADELLAIIGWAAFEPGDEIVIPQPSFEPYGTVTTLMGAAPVWSPLKDYRIDLADCARRLTPRAKAVILCSPHNPCGTILKRQELSQFIARLGDDPPLLILDEAYRDFADDPDCQDGVALVKEHKRVIALRTFSKIAGLAGLRVGFGVAQQEVVGMLNRVRAPYNVNRLAQVAAVAALEDEAHRERTVMLVKEERLFLGSELERRGLPAVPSQANFLLVKAGREAGAVKERLQLAGVLVRDGAALGFPGHLRISVGTRAQNMKLLHALDRMARG